MICLKTILPIIILIGAANMSWGTELQYYKQEVKLPYFVANDVKPFYIQDRVVVKKRVSPYASFRRLSPAQLMALAIYGEARSESYEGKLAVGTVILERHNSSGYSIKNVILKPHQFSCFNVKDKQYSRLNYIANNWKKRIEKDNLLQECLEIAEGLISGTIEGHQKLVDNKATHFKTYAVKPKWASKMRLVCRIDNHMFYTTLGEERKRVTSAAHIALIKTRNVLLSL